MHYNLFYITQEILQEVNNRYKLIYCTTLTLLRTNHKIFIPYPSAGNFAIENNILQLRDLPKRKYAYDIYFMILRGCCDI